MVGLSAPRDPNEKHLEVVAFLWWLKAAVAAHGGRRCALVAPFHGGSLQRLMSPSQGFFGVPS